MNGNTAIKRKRNNELIDVAERHFPQCQCPEMLRGRDCDTCKIYPRNEYYKNKSCEDCQYWRKPSVK